MTPRSQRRGRRQRLSRSAEFERVYRQGRSVANRHLVLYSFPNESAERLRMGLSVSRKVGGAVERNRVKRLLREAFDRLESGLDGGKDIVLVARPELRELAEREGLDGVQSALADLLSKSGLRSGEVAGVDRKDEGAGEDERGGPHGETDGEDERSEAAGEDELDGESATEPGSEAPREIGEAA